MNKKIIFIFIIFSFFVAFLYSGSDKADPDELITNIYLKNGFEQFKTANFEKAQSLSNIALSFSENSSDALYMRSLSSRNLGLIGFHKEDLRAAIIFNNWTYFNELSARVILSEIMYLDGDIEDAYLNLQPFSNNLAFSSKFSELFIRISLSVGKVEEALKIAENLLQVDPYDNYSQLIMAMYSSDWLIKAEEIILDGDPANYFSKEVIQLLIESRSDCQYLNELYLERWGEDRFYKISYACQRTNSLPEILNELYPDNTRVNFSELTRIYKLFDNENSKKIILDWLGSISLTVIYDSDGDGFTDTEAFYNKGQLYAFNYDSNHDNNYDYFIELDDLPLKLKVITKTGTESYFYKDYPYLVNVIKSDDKTVEDYQLIPYNLRFEIISVPLDYTKEMPHLLDSVVFPDNKILASYSTLKTLTNIEENTVSNYFVINLDESIENIFNGKGVKILERHYKKSVLLTVFRDFDDDGVFDTIYNYSDGKLQTVSFDENNNDIYEYNENYENGLTRSWDFNEDGLIDSREYFENGIIYRELSSNFDGVFDTTLEITSDTD